MMQSAAAAAAAPLASRTKGTERRREKERDGGAKRKKKRSRRRAWREDLHSWNELRRTMEGDRHVEGIRIKEVEDVKKSMRSSELLRPNGVTFDPA